MLFVCLFSCGSAYAREEGSSSDLGPEVQEVVENKWLDPYPKHIGLTYTVGADIVANYVWRGEYCGGLGIQPSLTVGYGGLWIGTWWNVGAPDWTFNYQLPHHQVKGLLAECDAIIGFSRWGLDIIFYHMYYFDQYSDGTNSRYFDFSDPRDGIGGITQEWRLRYRVSDKLPLSFFWGTRTWGRDGYLTNADGQIISGAEYHELSPEEQSACTRKRAYSTYIELGYDFRLPHEIRLEARVGMTPWKSLYTQYKGDFAVVNIDAKLVRSWDIASRCRLDVFAELAFNPYDMSKMAQQDAAYSSINGGRQVLWNVGCGVYLK